MKRAGDKVVIFNCAHGGEFFIEGEAVLVTRRRDREWDVRFPSGEVVRRFVDMRAQEDPQGHLRFLNGAA